MSFKNDVMSTKVLIIHGMGDQKEDWLDGLVALLKSRVDAEFFALSYAEVVNRVGLMVLTRQSAASADVPPKEAFDDGYAAACADICVSNLLGNEVRGKAITTQGMAANASITIKNLYKYAIRYLLGGTVRNGIYAAVHGQAMTHIDRIGAESRSLVLIGYSLGSVIALDLIRDPNIALYVGKLITVGSPLGGIARWAPDVLPESTRKVDRPWVDIASPDDIVAAVRVSQKLGFSGNDLEVLTTKKNHPDPHGAYFYKDTAVDEWASRVGLP